MKILNLFPIILFALSTPAFATDQVEDLMTQITFAGKAGDTKIFSADAETLMEIGYRFPTEFARLLEGKGKIYWTQMRSIPVRNEGTGPSVSIIATTIYATNQLCGHPLCRQPEEADFRILTVLRTHSCSRMADGSCTVSFASDGIKTKRMDALFWLGKKPLEN